MNFFINLEVFEMIIEKHASKFFETLKNIFEKYVWYFRI